MLYSSFDSAWALLLATLLGVALDWWLGEPRRWHPLVGFGRFVSAVEARLNRAGRGTIVQRTFGLLALLLVVLPIVLVADSLFDILKQWSTYLYVLVSAGLLYLAIGHRSMQQHADAVGQALNSEDLPLARQRVGYIVSRQTDELDETGVVKATLESVLENGSDALFAPLFWFLVAGPIGVLMYRLCNTLDAMWGYRNERYLHFGWAAARLDDLLNWLPARLCAVAYIFAGGFSSAHWLRCRQLWQQQAPACESPNAGPVMSAGASSLSISLGGGAHYFGQWQDRPELGSGPLPQRYDIVRTLSLVQKALLLWLAAAAVIVLLMSAVTAL